MSESRKPTYKHRIIEAGGKKFELLHHVNLNELQDILKKVPGLQASSIVRSYDTEKNPDAPFKIVVAEGNFSQVRLARSTDEQGEHTYYAQRKLLSTKKLDHKVDEIRKSLKDKVLNEKQLNAFKRENIFTTTKTELGIVNNIIPKLAGKNPVYVSEEKNKNNENQIYQFNEIASFKDLTSLSSFFVRGGIDINSSEKSAILERIANKMIAEVIHLHAINVTHRDIKPSNFLMNGDGNVTLSDFGSVAIYDKNKKLQQIAALASDQFYAAPENVKNMQPDSFRKACLHDQWALAISILEIYGINVMNANYQLRSKDATNVDYQNFMNRISNNPTFKSMPSHLREYIQNALDYSPNRKLEITDMVTLPEPQTSSEEIMKNTLQTAYEFTDRTNQIEIARITNAPASPRSSGTPSPSSSSSDYDENLPPAPPAAKLNEGEYVLDEQTTREVEKEFRPNKK